MNIRRGQRVRAILPIVRRELAYVDWGGPQAFWKLARSLVAEGSSSRSSGGGRCDTRRPALASDDLRKAFRHPVAASDDLLIQVSPSGHRER